MMLTAVLAVVAYNQWQLAKDKAVLVAREEFDHALDEAEALCGHCTCDGQSCGTWLYSSCTPSYLIAIPLDKAIRNEPKITDYLTAVEYNRLAILGSSVWNFDRTKQYIDKAIRVGHEPLDGFLSHLVMGHVYFRYLSDLPDTANIEKARNEFTEAVASLRRISIER